MGGWVGGWEQFTLRTRTVFLVNHATRLATQACLIAPVSIAVISASVVRYRPPEVLNNNHHFGAGHALSGLVARLDESMRSRSSDMVYVCRLDFLFRFLGSCR